MTKAELLRQLESWESGNGRKEMREGSGVPPAPGLAALRDSEERLRAILANAVEAIITIDDRGIIESVNPAAEKTFGYKAEELVGRNVSLLMPSPHREEHDAHIERYLRTGEARIIGIGRETVAQRKDGTVFPVELAVSEVRLANRRLFTGFVRDITERARIEDRIHTIIEASADAVVIADLDEIVQFVNPAAVRMFGRDRRDLTSRPFGFPILPGQTRELRISRADGSSLFAEMRVVEIEWGAKPAYLATLWDISERKRSEEQYRQVNEKLHGKHEELQSFYHTVSHELKTPLTSAREFVSLVLEGLAGPLTDTQKEYLLIAQQSCDQMRNCINDMLDTTRLDTGKMRLEFTRGGIGPLIQKVVTMLAAAAEEKGIQLTTEVRPGLPDVFMDRSRIEQVFTNLINNALKFTPKGGRITVSARPAPPGEQSVVMGVCDTGCGIPATQLGRIFDRLYQVQTGDAAASKGLGLGLHICRELVRLHGGDIRVESREGEGSSFLFTLPVEPARPSVLLVDDDPDFAKYLRRLLEDHEFDVSVAVNGTQALARLNERVPDVVVMDLSLSGIDDAETLKQIRLRWRQLPVVIHAGTADGKLMSRVLEFSPFTLLSKPCSPEFLVDTVRNLSKASKAPTVD